jgi:hypothetical protein
MPYLHSVNAAAEKEEVEEEVEAAKTEVADLWKKHDYLTSANSTKAERSNRLDLDIWNKTNRSQELDRQMPYDSSPINWNLLIF